MPGVFRYEEHYESILATKRADKSYRWFRNINRLARELPYAHSADKQKKVDVWCTNDYVRASQYSHDVPELRGPELTNGSS
jgi:5-aminolevulinate synthase